MESINNCKIFSYDIEVYMDNKESIAKILSFLKDGISSEDIICFDKNEVWNAKSIEVNMKDSNSTVKSLKVNKNYNRAKYTNLIEKGTGNNKIPQCNNKQLSCAKQWENEENIMPVIIAILTLYLRILK